MKRERDLVNYRLKSLVTTFSGKTRLISFVTMATCSKIMESSLAGL